MHILIVSETFPPEINGVARTLWQMTEGLGRRGHRISLVRPAQVTDRVSPRTDMDVAQYLTRGWQIPGYPDLQIGLPAPGLLQRLLRNQAVDVAYIATEGPLGMSALRACRRHAVPVLSGLHTHFDQYSRHYGLGLLTPLVSRHLRRFHNRTSTTLVPTTAMAGVVRSTGFERVRVWPRGVHADQFSPSWRDPVLRRSWGLAEDDLAVLYVGRIAAEKNIDLVGRAFRTIATAQPRARLILVGSGPVRARLQRQYPDAIFCGPLQGETLARHYASGDVFLFPSLTDTFGNVVLEAMASGLAVIAYAQAAAGELIHDGHNGLLATPGDEHAYLAQAQHAAANPGLLGQMKWRARATVMQHTWPRLIDSLEEILARLIADAAATARSETVRAP